MYEERERERERGRDEQRTFIEVEFKRGRGREAETPGYLCCADLNRYSMVSPGFIFSLYVGLLRQGQHGAHMSL